MTDLPEHKFMLGHGWFLESPGWFACTEPERPPDENVGWHNAGSCQGCMISVEALAHRHPNDPYARWLVEVIINTRDITSTLPPPPGRPSWV